MRFYFRSIDYINALSCIRVLPSADPYLLARSPPAVVVARSILHNTPVCMCVCGGSVDETGKRKKKLKVDRTEVGTWRKGST
mmetsp:Transcript_19657/g.35705  ORF Transcript_19657/g.35705 Transcript_19657/m.35705 type:complete len:82 (-) Transcript_19657:293-538(-)